MKRFYKIPKYGILNIDKIFFESYFPIIFTCINKSNQLFFVVCCKNNQDGCKWLICKTEPEKIVQLLKNKITVRNVLLESSERFSLNYIHNEYIFDDTAADFNENSIYLPKKDSFMYPDEGEFDKEIIYYSSKQFIEYKKEAYKNLIDYIEPIVMDNGTNIEVFNAVKTDIEKVIEHSEITKTLAEINDLYLTSCLGNESNEVYGVFKSFFEKIMINNDEISTDYDFYNSIYNAA